MVFNNNQHLYIKIKDCVKADLDAPYPDGSKIKKGSKHYKDIVKRNNENYSYLKPYIDSGELLLVSEIHFPNRGEDKNSYDFEYMTVSVWNDKKHSWHTFSVNDRIDEYLCKNHEYYIVEFEII